MSVECAIDRDEQEMLEAVRRTREEIKTPEGLNLYESVGKAIEGYWDQREREVAANSKGFFRSAADWIKKYVK
jgi:hypothetical protein